MSLKRIEAKKKTVPYHIKM